MERQIIEGSRPLTIKLEEGQTALVLGPDLVAIYLGSLGESFIHDRPDEDLWVLAFGLLMGKEMPMSKDLKRVQSRLVRDIMLWFMDVMNEPEND